MSRRRNPAYSGVLLSAATHVIADQGLGVATATIAKQAGVSAGTLFNYFQSKPVLVNELYVSLKCEMGNVAIDGLPVEANPHDQLRHVWDGGSAGRRTRRRSDAPSRISTSRRTSPRRVATRSIRALAGTAELLERCRATDRCKTYRPVSSCGSSTESQTRPSTTSSPSPARGSATNDLRTCAAFDAIWRAIAG